MVMSAFDDAKNYLYRSPGLTTDDPREIIGDLVREIEMMRRLTTSASAAQLRANKAEKKVELMLQLLRDLVHHNGRMTNKRLRDLQRELEKC